MNEQDLFVNGCAGCSNEKERLRLVIEREYYLYVRWLHDRVTDYPSRVLFILK